ncbi:MAG: glycosyltransferase family A protein [Candidatus Babeliales bacterium]
MKKMNKLISQFIIAISFVGGIVPFKGIEAATEGYRNIVVIVASYNNALHYKKNLDSIFSQNYPNFRVIYINDCSTDDTGNLVYTYAQARGYGSDRLYLIQNECNRKKLANFYSAVHELCDDDELIVELDGDDAFAHENVLSMINALHKNRDVWFSYGQYINVPAQAAAEAGLPILGYARPTSSELIEKKGFRFSRWLWSGVRIFDAWLFKQIRLESLIFQDMTSLYAGKFFPAMADGGMIFPMMEMAGKRIHHISDVIMRRTITPINDFKIHKELQIAVDKQLKASPVYATFDSRPEACHAQLCDDTIGIILVTPDTTIGQLRCYLTHYTKYCGQLSALFVLCERSLYEAEVYKAVEHLYDEIIFCSIDQAYSIDAIRTIIEYSANSYVLLSYVSEALATMQSSLQCCFDCLQRTQASACYCDSAHVVPSVKVDSMDFVQPYEWLYGFFYGFQHACIQAITDSVWGRSKMVLYNTKDLKEALMNCSNQEIQNYECIAYIAEQFKKEKKAGIFAS